MVSILDRALRYSFYLLFFLVPLVFYHRSSELFEYNKMMLTYGFTVLIAGAWLAKMVLQKKIIFRRTFLDIPISLYLLSHILSTLTSIDQHTSIWGYYSRFHEGLLATISYIILFYALVSNLDKRAVFRIIMVSLAAGVIVSLWGALEHFGASPSCLIITQKFDVDCWVQDVRNRVFATLGQPNWMAAYLDVLILISLGYVLNFKLLPNGKNSEQSSQFQISNFKFVTLAALFFSALLFTKSRSGVLGLLTGLVVIGLFYFWNNRGNVATLISKPLLVLIASLALMSFIIGLPLPYVDKLNWESLTANKNVVIDTTSKQQDTGYIDIGVTESGDIRQIVWKGALKIWQRYPVLGSGVETFAYAYYLDRPVEHNMVSEWDFLYNKAHNEFLNLLATTGAVGILAYLILIGAFSWWTYKKAAASPLVIALFAAYISILITNFFGFSVVIIGLYFFLIPGFCLLLSFPDELGSVKSNSNPSKSQSPPSLSGGQWITVSILLLVAFYLEWALLNKWSADVDYGWGKNYDSVQGFLQANEHLVSAVKKDHDEPVFHDELSYNSAVIASGYIDKARELEIATAEAMIRIQPYVDQAITSSDKAVSSQPDNVIFWRTRTKVFNQLTNIDERYAYEAVAAVIKATQLAPTDPRVIYNLGLVLGNVGETDQALASLQKAVELKPDYADAHYALGRYYDQLGDKDKARAEFEFMLKYIGEDDRARKWLEENP